MTLPVEQELQTLRQRVESLERAASSIPPAHDLPNPSQPTAAKSAWRNFIDEKVIITGMISLVGIWATVYTNGRALQQEELSQNQQLELETAKYQLGQYLSADDQEERIIVLRFIQDAPYTSAQMKHWANGKFEELSETLIKNTRSETTIAEAAEIKVEKIERGEGAELTPEERQRAESAGERAAVAVKTQIEQGTIRKAAARPAVSPRERARVLWSQGYEEYKKKNYARAEELYQSSAKVDPSYAPAVNSLGNIALLRRQHDRAEKYFRDAAKLDPTYAPAAYNLVLALEAQQRPEDAKSQLAEAIRVSPKYALRTEVESAVRAPNPALQQPLRLE
jgi:tetratricopeptide (TPR) repeat protein